MERNQNMGFYRSFDIEDMEDVEDMENIEDIEDILFSPWRETKIFYRLSRG